MKELQQDSQQAPIKVMTQQNYIFNVQRQNKYQHKFQYPIKLSFKNDNKIYDFSEKQR